MKRPLLPPPVQRADEKWFTAKEAGALLHRSPRTILNLMYLYGIPRRKIRQGRHPRRIVVFSEDALMTLRRITRT